MDCNEDLRNSISSIAGFNIRGRNAKGINSDAVAKNSPPATLAYNKNFINPDLGYQEIHTHNL